MFNKLGMFDRSLGMFQPPGSIPFSPSQIFAALQGAWLEPTPGSIWQENTGVTPTTTGGQTIGKISDQSGWGNNATQATAGNRPLLGRRYNLLTYSEDFSNAAWEKSGSTIVNNVFSATSSLAYVIQPITFTQPTSVTITAKVKSGSTNIVWFYHYSGAEYGFAYFDLNNLTTQVVAGSSASPSNLSITASGANYVISATWLSFSGSSAYWGFGISDAMGNESVTVGKTAYLYAIDVRLTADVGKDPAYQRITTATDYDYGQYPAAVHDETDNLVVSLPSINVRRNLLYYSDRFDITTVIAGSTWTLFGTTAVYNTKAYGVLTGSTFTPGGTNTYLYRRSMGLPLLAPGTYTFTALAAGNSTVNLGVYDVALGYWQGITVQFTTTPTRYSFTATVTTSTQQIGIGRIGGIGGSTAGAFDLYYMQVEAGSVATDYQRVTDWTSEAYSSNGSVYFATPVGMSALHNQSMGTSYTLPALSSDIYSWIVVPQRLSTVLESRLERYMLRKAGLTEPDYLLDTTYGQLTADDGEQLLLAQ